MISPVVKHLNKRVLTKGRIPVILWDLLVDGRIEGDVEGQRGVHYWNFRTGAHEPLDARLDLLLEGGDAVA